jgi:hypothetical protein
MQAGWQPMIPRFPRSGQLGGGKHSRFLAGCGMLRHGTSHPPDQSWNHTNPPRE